MVEEENEGGKEGEEESSGDRCAVERMLRYVAAEGDCQRSEALLHGDLHSIEQTHQKI